MTLVSQIRLLNESTGSDIMLSEGNREWIHRSEFDYWINQNLEGSVYAVDNVEPYISMFVTEESNRKYRM